MTAKIRTVVTFESTAFNTVEQKEYFINPGCFGDDVAKWVAEQLHDKGHKTADNTGQEDFGWYLNFTLSGIDYCFVIGYRPDDDEAGTWIGWLERRRGLIASLFGGRKRDIEPAAPKAIDEILSSHPQIHGVRWHFDSDFTAGREEFGMSMADGA